MIRKEIEMYSRANLLGLQFIGVFFVSGILFGSGLISNWTALAICMGFVGIKSYIDMKYNYANCKEVRI